jgi:hypothetical protein
MIAGGYKTQLTTNGFNLSDQVLTEPEVQIKKTVVRYNEPHGYLLGLKLFDKLGKEVLKPLCSNDGYKSKEYLLEDVERIVGFTSRALDNTSRTAWHCDLQFIIGRMSVE